MINYYDNEIENDYSSKTDVKYRRSLGQFFTPFKIASFLAEWVLGNKKENLTMLDPATGLGIFERAIKFRSKGNNIKFDLWEIDENLSRKLMPILSELNIDVNIFNSDFLTGTWGKKYDGIIANPPYYKHHHINNKEEIYQDICLKTYFRFSIQTNIYCWFLIKSMNLLADGGRLAFIVPSEFLNANYGEKIKEYLLKSGIVLHLININFEENVFDNALTTSVIIFAEKKPEKSSVINFFNVSDVNQLDDLEGFLKSYPRISINTKDLDPKIKWRNYFNGYRNEEDKNLIPFSKIGRFSRGIATGSNEYFTLTPEEKSIFKISNECLYPCITKAGLVKNIIFTKNDYENLVKQNKKVYLFNGEGSKDISCLAYIKRGEKEGINNKFLTKNRTPWYALEKRKASIIWVSVFGRKGLKFIWNKTDCKNLTCFHAYYPTEYGKKYLDILFIYLNTDIAKKLFDREKREFGNGLEKFEPNDLNKSLIYNFEKLSAADLNKLRNIQHKLVNGGIEKKNSFVLQAGAIFKKYF
jgi:adenine-specific DNA-methyltransferase